MTLIILDWIWKGEGKRSEKLLHSLALWLLIPYTEQNSKVEKVTWHLSID